MEKSLSHSSQNTGDRKSLSSEGRTKKLVLYAMLSAAAYAVMVLIHLKIIPSAPFLTYDPKDVVIAIGGFAFGPSAVLVISLVVSFIEMITVSDSGIIGFVMQVIATLSFAGTAAVIYRRMHIKRGAELGLAAGTVLMVVVMVVWNYILTPLYLGTDRSEVLPLLSTAIIPFNLIKGIINSIVLMLVYKPVVNALRRYGFLN